MRVYILPHTLSDILFYKRLFTDKNSADASLFNKEKQLVQLNVTDKSYYNMKCY